MPQMTNEQAHEIAELAVVWHEKIGANVQREVLHCSFPFPCECCAESALLSAIKRLLSIAKCVCDGYVSNPKCVLCGGKGCFHD